MAAQALPPNQHPAQPAGPAQPLRSHLRWPSRPGRARARTPGGCGSPPAASAGFAAGAQLECLEACRSCSKHPLQARCPRAAGSAVPCCALPCPALAQPPAEHPNILRTCTQRRTHSPSRRNASTGSEDVSRRSEQTCTRVAKDGGSGGWAALGIGRCRGSHIGGMLQQQLQRAPHSEALQPANISGRSGITCQGGAAAHLCDVVPHQPPHAVVEADVKQGVQARDVVAAGARRHQPRLRCLGIQLVQQGLAGGLPLQVRLGRRLGQLLKKVGSRRLHGAPGAACRASPWPCCPCPCCSACHACAGCGRAGEGGQHQAGGRRWQRWQGGGGGVAAQSPRRACIGLSGSRCAPAAAPRLAGQRRLHDGPSRAPECSPTAFAAGHRRRAPMHSLHGAPASSTPPLLELRSGPAQQSAGCKAERGCRSKRGSPRWSDRPPLLPGSRGGAALRLRLRLRLRQQKRRRHPAVVAAAITAFQPCAAFKRCG